MAIHGPWECDGEDELSQLEGGRRDETTKLKHAQIDHHLECGVEDKNSTEDKDVHMEDVGKLTTSNG